MLVEEGVVIQYIRYPVRAPGGGCRAGKSLLLECIQIEV